MPAPALARVLASDATALLLWQDGRTVRRPAVAPPERLQPGDLVREQAEDWAVVARPGADALHPDGDLGRLLRDGARRDAALRDRAALLQAIRADLDRRGFLEVETPAIATSPGLELHLDAVGAALREGMAGAPVQRWLVTSPEYHCKRLLHAGLPRIYSLAKAFRSGERGGWHNPEFTMLEWYRAGEDSGAIIADALRLLRRTAAAVERSRRARGDDRSVFRPSRALRLSFAGALRRFAGMEMNGRDGLPLPIATLRARANAAGATIRPDDAEADVLLAVFAECVEPALTAHDVVVIERWPQSLASLARRLPDAPHLAERFEIYVRGVELANGFGELVDADEQRQRFEADLSARRARGLPIYPIDERFLDALRRGCPPASGVALGVDRLLMAVGGYDDIDEVLAFPFERA